MSLHEWLVPDIAAHQGLCQRKDEQSLVLPEVCTNKIMHTVIVLERPLTIKTVVRTGLPERR
jgi:hypothetical protein